MPWPLVCAGLWCVGLAYAVYDACRDRDAEQRIDSYGQVDVPFVPEWDDEDNERIADREYMYDLGILW